jgi:hypothetical protein
LKALAYLLAMKTLYVCQLSSNYANSNLDLHSLGFVKKKDATPLVS